MHTPDARPHERRDEADIRPPDRGTAMPTHDQLLALFEPSRRQKVHAEWVEHGYVTLQAKTHPRDRRLRDTRTAPGPNALEMAGTAAMRGATEVEPVNRQDIHGKTDGTCYLCGRNVHVNTFAIDHCIPLYRGGSHTWANLYPACTPCNESKAARPVAIEISTGNALIL